MKSLAAPYLHSSWGAAKDYLSITQTLGQDAGSPWAVSCHVDDYAPANVIERYRCARILIGCAAGSG